MRLIPLFTALAFAPHRALADAGTGAPVAPSPSGPVLEVVRFRLTKGASQSAFMRAAEATQAPLRQQPGFVARQLVCDATGLWTDLVTWRDSGAAEAGASAMMADPAFGPFMALIEGATVEMSHPLLMMRMD